MKLQGRPAAAFDPDGLIFAAGINSESVKLYDLRSFDKGPFSSFKFNGDYYYHYMVTKCNLYLPVDSSDIVWTGLKFSPDGKSILISTNGSVIKLIDSYNGTSLQTFTGKDPPSTERQVIYCLYFHSLRSSQFQAASAGGFLLT